MNCHPERPGSPAGRICRMGWRARDLHFAANCSSLASLGMTNSSRTNFSGIYSVTFRNLSEFVITDTELKLMAAAARTGLSSSPKTGYNTPAAIGTPIEL